MLTFQVSRAVRHVFWDRLGANKVSSVLRCYEYSHIFTYSSEVFINICKECLLFQRVDVRYRNVREDKIVFTAL